MNNILKKPLISEKSYGMSAKGVYTFIVDRHARKEEIAKVCADIFGVTVLEVSTANYNGKVKRTRKGEGKRSDFKKAFIKLKAGEKIDLFEIEEAGKEEAPEKAEKKKEDKKVKEKKFE